VVKEAAMGSKVLAIARFHSPPTGDVDHLPTLGLVEVPGGGVQEGVPTSALGITEANIPDELLSLVQQIVTL
jgi:hypothetical protein